MIAPVAQALDVERTYRMQGVPIHALRGVTLDVGAGEFLALVGPSGSGKSTLLHLLGGVDKPDVGRVMAGGTDLSSLNDQKLTRHRLEHVGLVFQRFHLLPMLTATENVEIPLAEIGLRRAERRQRSRELLERVGLGDRMKHRPGELSGGQRQRVAIARALANRPSLLLADEPTGELDRETSKGILELFESLAGSGTAIVVATHDLKLAAAAGRQLKMVDGRLNGLELS
ncbi:MAG: ABC transporter ATP-binding protein [marine benthic group bacterium]|jgi:putative ABC transport system ATP-binding protein|nr:ABC transporter ATP-binding protein [Gemmatimonadota bacterium]